MTMKDRDFRLNIRFVLVFAVLFLLGLQCVQAQSGGPYQITQSVLPGGGGATSGGTLHAEGTIGQGLAGGSSGGVFTLNAGFPSADIVSSAAINGTVTFNGVGLDNVTMTLSGSSSAVTSTDSSGNYSFANLPDGSFTVTPSKTNFAFIPDHRDVVLSGVSQTADFAASSTAVASGGNGSLLISEFRLQGPVPSVPVPGNLNGEIDEYIELYNASNSVVDISGYVLDTSVGFSLVIPPGASLQPFGHYLIANNSGYSLSSVAVPDLTWTAFDLPLGTGLALLNVSHQIVDAAGFTTSPAPNTGHR